MSRPVSNLRLVTGTKTHHDISLFGGTQQAHLNQVLPLSKEQIDSATVLVHFRAPDLAPVLGLTGTVTA